MFIFVIIKARYWMFREVTTHPVLQFFAWMILPVFYVLFASGFVAQVAPQAVGMVNCVHGPLVTKPCNDRFYSTIQRIGNSGNENRFARSSPERLFNVSGSNSQGRWIDSYSWFRNAPWQRSMFFVMLAYQA